jgi:uncharacterized membrane protein
MDKMLVAVFDTESAAYEGRKALEDLHRSGDISVYGTAVITKDSTGKVETKQGVDAGAPATAVGILAGGLLGLLAGPAAAYAGGTAAAASTAALAGAYVGAAGGALGGGAIDLTRYGFSLEFIDEVSKDLVPGKAALIAEIDETWLAPVDTQLGRLGGTVFRHPTTEVVEQQLKRESAEIDAEMKKLEAEITQADAKNKAALKGQLERTKQRAESMRTQVRESLERAKNERDAKIHALQDQMGHAKDERKAEIQHRIDEANADYERRRALLDEARPLLKEAVRL